MILAGRAVHVPRAFIYLHTFSYFQWPSQIINLAVKALFLSTIIMPRILLFMRNLDFNRNICRRIYGCLQCLVYRLEFVMHYQLCSINTSITPYYTTMYDSQIMHKSRRKGMLYLPLQSHDFSQSACMSLRLMSYQEKQERGCTFSILK